MSADDLFLAKSPRDIVLGLLDRWVRENLGGLVVLNELSRLTRARDVEKRGHV